MTAGRQLPESYPTILEVFKRSVHDHGDRRAVVTPAERGRGREYVELTYRELDELSDRVAAGLVHQGIRPDEKVAVLARPRPEWLAAVLGIHKAGAVAVPIDPLLKAAEVHRLIAACDALGAIVSGDLFPLVEGLETLEFVVHLDTDGEIETDGRWRVLPWREFLIDRPPPHRELEPGDLAFMLYTSGTMGDAKAVMLAHENVTANIYGVLDRLDVSSDDVVISIAPWNHSFGLIALIAVLWVGGTLVYTNDYLRLADVMKRYGATMLVAVPKLYHSIFQRVEAAIEESPLRRMLQRFAPRVVGWTLKRKLAGGRLRFFVSGSAPLSPRVIRGFRRLGIGMIEGYGMTEASPVLTFSTPFNDKPGSVGPPLCNVELKVIDANDEGIGEVLVRGPNIMRGYYKNPKRTREVLDDDGWLHTGDLGYLDEENWLYIKGRRKNVIVLETGKNVYPEEIEWELSRIPYIEDVLVRSAKRKDTEVIQALVYPNWEEIGEPRPKEEVRRLIWEEIRKRSDHLASYKRIKSEQDVILVDEPFEKTSLKDIKRYLYAEAIETGAEEAPSSGDRDPDPEPPSERESA